MEQTENYVVQSVGKVKGGTASYSVDLDTGHVEYQASVTAGVLFFTKTFNFSGPYDVPVNDLRSTNLKNVGDTLSVGNIKFTLKEIGTPYNTFSVEVIGQQMSGIAMIDCSSEFIKVASLNANAVVSGFAITLNLQRVQS